LAVNGASGIAVGYATNLPPHNLGEICDAIVFLVDNPEATPDELLRIVPGPDFPTAGIIQGRKGVRDAHLTGQGHITIRARATVEEGTTRGRRAIVVTELPYQTNKAALVKKIAELARGKRLEGIAEVRDESGREGIRVVIELKRDAQPQLLLNNLYKHTPLQSSFAVNNLALVDGQPHPNLTLQELLQFHIDFRRVVITRRSRFELKQSKDRAHILEGLRTALDHLEEIIQLIRRAKDTEAARKALETRFSLSSIQAQAILDLALKRLAALERQKILDEYAEVLQNIARLEDLLANPRKIDFLIQQEVRELKAKSGDKRRTEIVEEEAEEFQVEDLIPHEPTVIFLSQQGYIKRLGLESFRTQHRPGHGISGGDGARSLVVADTHDRVLFFTQGGKVFRLKAYQIPAESRTSRGTPLMAILPLEAQDRVTAILALSHFSPGSFLVLATAQGKV
jgi:DNA gyrase subunit A